MSIKKWVGLFISDEGLRGAVETLLMVDDSTQIIGKFESTEQAISGLAKRGDVVVIMGLGGAIKEELNRLKLIQLNGPYPVLGVGDAKKSAPILFDAFRLGMLDFIPFNPGDVENPTDYLLKEMTGSIDILSRAQTAKIKRVRIASTEEAFKKMRDRKPSFFIVVGVPGGGVASAIRLVASLPRRSDTSLILSLPIEYETTGPFVKRLDEFSVWPVVEVKGEEDIKGGICYLVPSSSSSDNETVFGAEGSIDGEPRLISIPESSGPIDTMMDSMAESFGESVLGILTDGKGTDGIIGIKAIRDRGGTAITIKKGGGILPSLTEDTKNAKNVDIADLVVDMEGLPETLKLLVNNINDLIGLNQIINMS